MAEVNLAELVRDTVGIVRPMASGQEIDLHVEQEPWVLADAGRLQQVLLNVLTNAITHARASQRIELHVRGRDQAEVSVRDFGPGIPGERLAGLFSSTRPLPPSSSGDGLGLGLYISTAIMAAHGGGLTAASELGEGTTVVISLPAVPAPVAPARA
jgi:two-component system sensor histidine kinase KdpD